LQDVHIPARDLDKLISYSTKDSSG
jgi:hypothetical protein